MSAYPPPPPPVYDRRAMKQYARMMKDRARAQRMQMRMQMRGMRRHSIVGPLVLLAVGIIFLMAQTGKVSWPYILTWYAHWWPVVLIGAGVILLCEWAIGQQLRPDVAHGRVPILGGGVVFLLIALAIVGVGSRATDHALNWDNGFFGHNWNGVDLALGDTHDSDDSVSAAMPEGGSLLIRNPRGDISVTGSSDDGRVHVSVHKEVAAHSDHDAQTKEDRMQPVFSVDGNEVTLTVASLTGAHDDLTIQVPRNTPLTITADHGAVDVQEIHAPVSITANAGEVNVSGVDGALNAHVNDEDSSFSAHSITGPVTIEGHAGDIDLTDITGAVNLNGEFMGTTHLERVTSGVHFKTFRTQFDAARIDGELEIGKDDLNANSLVGPIVVKTSSKDITLERVQGSIDIADRVKGDVSVTSAGPLGPITVANDHGSVDVGVPAGASFTLSADTKNADIENDFGLHVEGSEDHSEISGKVGNGGAAIIVHTADGNVTIRKATVAPLPPLPPLPPRITITPPSPAPKLPSVPKLPEPKIPASAKLHSTPPAPPPPAN